MSRIDNPSNQGQGAVDQIKDKAQEAKDNVTNR